MKSWECFRSWSCLLNSKTKRRHIMKSWLTVSTR